ncbi:MAG: SRPBCC domain-containing protein [Myxococcales bacterium]|nr:SRPBCC domain-containing protein [Myxococcales bacterium]
MSDWWSKDHHWGPSALRRQVLEARTGGRCYSVSDDGSERELGRVIRCEPPSRLVLACHGLTAHGERPPDPALETDIEITFTDGGGVTVVRLEHRALERFGARAWEVRGHLDAVIGWRATPDDFARAFRPAAR